MRRLICRHILLTVLLLLAMASCKKEGPVETNNEPPGPVAYYPLNANANDASGNGRHGTVNGATLAVDKNGKTASAYAFAAGSWIDFGDILGDVFENNKYTISVWYKTVGSNNGGLISKWTDVNLNTGNAFWYVPLGFSTNANGTAFPSVGAGVWTHDVVVIDKGSLVLFRNGTRTIQANGHNSVSSAGRHLMVGGLGSGAPQYQFLGTIDDIRIYDRALSESEAKALWDAGP